VTESDDRRFAELIHDEFGVDVPPASTFEARAAKPRRGRRTPRRPDTAPTTAGWFSLDRAIDEARPDAEPFTPPETPPLHWPRRPLVWAGLVLIVAAIVTAVVAMALGLPAWLRWGPGLAIGAGLACLLFSLPRHKEPPLDDGAVV